MGSSAPTPPSLVDPNKAADTQQTYNVNAAAAGQAASAVNQNTPWGSLTYQQSGTGPGGIPLYTATTSLDPSLQGLFNALKGQSSNLISGANYGSQNPSDVVGGMTSGLTKDLLGKEIEYLNPFFDRQTTQLDTKLRNQGFDPGSPAYQQAMNNLLQSQNQSVTGFLAQAEPAAYQQATSSYLLPLTTATNEINLLNPTSNVKGSLTPTPTTSVSSPDYLSALSNYQTQLQQQYQEQLQQSQSAMAGMFGIPSAILGGWAQSGFAGL